MEVLVYLVLGLSIWILVPSERSALLERASERSAQSDGRASANTDTDDGSQADSASTRDR